MKNYAVVTDGLVVNVVVIDGDALIELEEGNPAWIGWSYDGTTFSPPPPPEDGA